MSISENANNSDEQFQPVGLAKLNERAAMLERLNNKYIACSKVLASALPLLAERFNILEIGDRRAFAYDTCYFDGDRLESYFDHHQGKRKRAKVRMRRYVDFGENFLELKVKGNRGRTIKIREPWHDGQFGELDSAALSWVARIYRDAYQCEFPHDLHRVLNVRYERVTLVSKIGAERVTIDSGVNFTGNLSETTVRADRFVLEAKSTNGNGVADRIMRYLGQHPVAHCSKYCIGIALVHSGIRRNKFLPAIRRLWDTR